MYVFMKNKPYTFYLHCLLHETQELPEYIFHIAALLATYVLGCILSQMYSELPLNMMMI